MKTLLFDLPPGKIIVALLVCMICATVTGLAQQRENFLKKKKGKKEDFAEQIDFEGMVKLYLTKEWPSMEKLEGIYSVSAIVTKRGGFLSNPNKEKVVARKDNYAKVVIIKDTENSKRDYMEVSLDSRQPGRYPVVGEFTTLADGEAFVYKHYEPETQGISFSFVLSEFDLLDGILTKVVKRKTITYKLSYLKVYPKKEDVSVRQLSNNR